MAPTTQQQHNSTNTIATMIQTVLLLFLGAWGYAMGAMGSTGGMPVSKDWLEFMFILLD
jgi:hypothetical protein